VLEARQRLEALVIPKRQALTRLQGLLAPLLDIAEMAFPQQLKTSILRLFGYISFAEGLMLPASHGQVHPTPEFL